MTDLIEIKKEKGKVIVVNTILKNQKNEEVLSYAKSHFTSTQDHHQYGFDKSIWGIGTEGCILPMDNSDKFFGIGAQGLVIVCPNKEEFESYGISDLYIMYDGEEYDEELIHF